MGLGVKGSLGVEDLFLVVWDLVGVLVVFFVWGV